MVFYRKYRPQTIFELDSEIIRESLTAILSGVDTPHAMLFTGPKGLGKTSTARILAKAINCLTRKGTDVEPCNACEQCVSITAGTNLDVIEIDAASNRGIDEIRDLKDKIRLAPLKAKKKVYIIDEVHMLTTEAFNALLKTLEEPPVHAMFVLCTTEPHKIPATIFSRSFHIAFSEATPDELVRSFRRIADGEKLIVEDSVLTQIASIADGGFRDGAKIMEELAALSKGQPITTELVEKRYKIGSISQGVTMLINSLSNHDTKKSLAVIAQLSVEGIDIKYVTQQLIDTLHHDLLIVAGAIDGEQSQKSKFTLSELRELLLLLTKAHADIKYAVLSQIPLELAIIDWGERGATPVQSYVKVEKQSSEVTLTTLRKQTGHMQKIKAMYGETEEKKETPAPIMPKVTLMNYSASSDTKEWTDNLWQHVISEMKAYNHTIAGVLRGCFLKSYDRKSLVIEASYKFHKDKLSETKTLQALEQICRQLTGNPVSVTIELKSS
jgi:DNA polymerase-3 subunit gamma/tau